MKVKILRILLIVLILILLFYCTFLALNKQQNKNNQDNYDITKNINDKNIDLNYDSQVIDSYEIQDIRMIKNEDNYSFMANISKNNDENDKKVKELKITFLSEQKEVLYQEVINLEEDEYYPIAISAQFNSSEDLSLTKTIDYELVYEE